MPCCLSCDEIDVRAIPPRNRNNATAASLKHYFFCGAATRGFLAAATRGFLGEGALAFDPPPRNQKPAMKANALPTRTAVKGFSWICRDTDRVARRPATTAC